MVPLDARPGLTDELAVVGVTQWAVPQVVAETRELDTEHVLVGDAELGLARSQIFHEAPSQVRDADRVCKSFMSRARKDPLRGSQLEQFLQALELRRVDDEAARWMQ